MNQLADLPPEIARHRILDSKEAAAFVSLSRNDVLRKCKAGQFVTPVKLGARKLGFRVGDLVDWLESRTHAEAA